MSVRDRPTKLDWLAVGVRATGMVARIRAERRELRSQDPWDYFDDEGIAQRWIEIPIEFRHLVMQYVQDECFVEDFWDGNENSTRVVQGKLGQEIVAWLENGKAEVIDGPYVRANRESETYIALGKKLWAKLGSRHAAYSRKGLVPDPFEDDEMTPTGQFADVRARLLRFGKCNIPRSYLFLGPPGTGKSVGIRFLARSLNMTSLRVDLDVLSKRHHNDNTVVASIDTLIKVLRPQALIIDDLDRVDASGALLHFLELASRMCKVVLASANCTTSMLGAALRPGRFDEVVIVDRLDARVRKQILGPDADLADKLSALPVAYLAEFAKRRKVLGREIALAELGELQKRREMIEKQDCDSE